MKLFVVEYWPQYSEWTVDEVLNPLLVGTQRTLVGAVSMAFANGADAVSINLHPCLDVD
jgi:hypothetical protein